MQRARFIATSKNLYNFARFTTHCLTVCVDRRPLLRLVFCCLLTACDYSAISPYTTTGRLHEPSLRHVRRLHVMLTTELQSVQPTILLLSPRARATPVRPHEPSSRHVSRLYDILTTGVRCVKPTVQLSFSAVTTKRRRLHDYLTSGL